MAKDGMQAESSSSLVTFLLKAKPTNKIKDRIALAIFPNNSICLECRFEDERGNWSIVKESIFLNDDEAKTVVKLLSERIKPEPTVAEHISKQSAAHYRKFESFWNRMQEATGLTLEYFKELAADFLSPNNTGGWFYLEDYLKHAAEQDKHLNSIPLAKWDRFHSYFYPAARRAGLTPWSLSDSVCLAKHIVRAHIVGITIEDDYQMINRWGEPL